MPIISYKELLSEDFELRIALTKGVKSYTINRVALVVEKEGATFIRWLPLTTTFKLLLINSPEVTKMLRYINKNKFEIKLEGSPKLRRMIEQID